MFTSKKPLLELQKIHHQTYEPEHLVLAKTLEPPKSKPRLEVRALARRSVFVSIGVHSRFNFNFIFNK